MERTTTSPEETVEVSIPSQFSVPPREWWTTDDDSLEPTIVLGED